MARRIVFAAVTGLVNLPWIVWFAGVRYADNYADRLRDPATSLRYASGGAGKNAWRICGRTSWIQRRRRIANKRSADPRLGSCVTLTPACWSRRSGS